ncbi:MAG: hypothetical protein JO222_07515 [Frankiales bacterium]|nr:hypothetical protein [Frankiales bacterium]
MARSARPVPPDDPEADAPEWWRRSARLRTIPLVAVVVIAIVLLRAGQGPSYPAIAKNCTTPSFVMSTSKTPAHRLVQWTATGPAKLRFVLGVGVSGYVRSGSHFAPIPDAGVRRLDALTSAPQTMGKGCVSHGQFSLITPGTFNVRMFEITGPQSSETVTQVATRQITVTSS